MINFFVSFFWKQLSLPLFSLQASFFPRPVVLYNPSSPGALELVICFLFSDVDPALCMFVEQTGPPLYVVLCPGWIKWAGVSENSLFL